MTQNDESTSQDNVVATTDSHVDASNAANSGFSSAVDEINRQFEEKAAIEKARELSLPYVYISQTPINFDLLKLVEYDQAVAALALPFFKTGKKIRVAVADLGNELTKKVIEGLQNKGLEVSIHLASAAGMREALKIYEKRHYTAQKEVISQFDESKLQSYEKEIEALKDVRIKLAEVSSEEALNLIDVSAIKTGASDIHYEPEENVTVVRFRIDGVLHKVFEVKNDVFFNIGNQIKYKCKMKLNINNVPQDGRYSFNLNERQVDVRVSTLPTQYGESFVCRYLDSKVQFKTFEDLGFDQEYIKIINKLLQLSNGMILVTGPTGSGKTTSLYAMLTAMNNQENKIITLEDPIEYHIGGISQSQINEKREFTFASGLRAILRQDPDIIMLGEIRDLETAETAAQAALTGHVLLSTLHTNSAIESIPRLVNMGLPHFMISPSLSCVLAQRLVRKICPDCHIMAPVAVSEKEDLEKYIVTIQKVRKDFNMTVPAELPKIQGCEKCSHTGYKGRLVVAEILLVDFEIREMVLNKQSTVDMIQSARHKGMITMREDGIIKVLNGVTTLEEVYRATNILS